MIVTPEAPVKAVKKAQAAIDTMARPPGNQPSSAPVRRTSRFGAPIGDYRFTEMWAGPPDPGGTFDVEDGAAALIRFERGLTLDLSVSWAANLPETILPDGIILLGDRGGVYVNVGSAVILPEVFLKALSLARNLGHKVERLTTVNLDFIRHYRPSVNIVQRPTRLGGRGISLIGHHEIMVPLLAAGVLEAQSAPGARGGGRSGRSAARKDRGTS